MTAPDADLRSSPPAAPAGTPAQGAWDDVLRAFLARDDSGAGTIDESVMRELCRRALGKGKP